MYLSMSRVILLQAGGMRAQAVLLLLLVSCACVVEGRRAFYGQECGDNPMKQVLGCGQANRQVDKCLTHALHSHSQWCSIILAYTDIRICTCRDLVSINDVETKLQG